MPTNEMILDISSIGGFLDNIKFKNNAHAPMWRTTQRAINIEGKFYDIDEWYAIQKNLPDWTKTDTPFNIPKIMKPLVGLTKYPVRQDLLDKIARS